MISHLGVSKAILNHVIFCHQEESAWYVCVYVCLTWLETFARRKILPSCCWWNFYPLFVFIDYMATLTALMKIYSTDMLCISADVKVAVLGKSFFCENFWL